MINFSVKFAALLVLLSLGGLYAKKSLDSEKQAIVFKAEAPVDPEDQRKYGFGSILQNKKDFLKIKKTQEGSTKKDISWNAAVTVLNIFPIAYLNKESGTIKTEEVYVHEFDNTDSCKYRIVVNVSEDGDISVLVNSSDDSQTRLRKHEILIKNRILKDIESHKA